MDNGGEEWEIRSEGELMLGNEAEVFAVEPSAEGADDVPMELRQQRGDEGRWSCWLEKLWGCGGGCREKAGLSGRPEGLEQQQQPKGNCLRQRRSKNADSRTRMGRQMEICVFLFLLWQDGSDCWATHTPIYIYVHTYMY